MHAGLCKATYIYVKLLALITLAHMTKAKEKHVYQLNRTLYYHNQSSKFT